MLLLFVLIFIHNWFRSKLHFELAQLWQLWPLRRRGCCPSARLISIPCSVPSRPPHQIKYGISVCLGKNSSLNAFYMSMCNIGYLSPGKLNPEIIRDCASPWDIQQPGIISHRRLSLTACSPEDNAFSICRMEKRL